MKKKIFGIFLFMLFSFVCFNLIKAGGLKITINTPISFPVDM